MFYGRGRTFSLELRVSVVGLEGGDVVRPQRREGLVRTVRLLQSHRQTKPETPCQKEEKVARFTIWG